MRIRSPMDFWCGALFVTIGVCVIVLAQDYRLGSAARMGPGYFPTLLGSAMALLGLSLSIPALLKDGEPMPRMHVRPLLMILLSIGAFGAALVPLGFVAAIVILVVVSSLADPQLKPLEIAALSLFMTLFSTLVFVVLLGLPLPLWPSL